MCLGICSAGMRLDICAAGICLGICAASMSSTPARRTFYNLRASRFHQGQQLARKEWGDRFRAGPG